LGIRKGPGAGETVDMPEGRFVLGRDPSADLSLDDSEASRQHAAISVTPDGRVTIEDLGSLNGTYVNGQKITGPTELTGGEQIRVGVTELDATVPPAVATTKPGAPIPTTPPTTPGSPQPPPPPAQPEPREAPPAAEAAAVPLGAQQPPAAPPPGGRAPSPPGFTPPGGGAPPPGDRNRRNLVIGLAPARAPPTVAIALALPLSRRRDHK